jgi:hypothetical protein
MFTAHAHDWIDCKVIVPHDAKYVTLALRGRNSLENTILLYDVMMRDQGLEVFDWLEKLNTSLWYAWRLSKWYQTISGIEVSTEHDGEFEVQGKIRDTGPIAWKNTAIRIPLGSHGDTVRIRLSFMPDSWNIDWVAFDTTRRSVSKLQYAKCSTLKDRDGAERTDAMNAITKDDDGYLITNPGDWMDLSFDLPAKKDAERTLFVILY